MKVWVVYIITSSSRWVPSEFVTPLLRTQEEHITAIISFKTHFDKRISSPSLDSGCSKKQRSLKSYVRSKMFAIAIIIHLPLKWCPFQKWKLLRSSYFTFRNASENITMFSNCKKNILLNRGVKWDFVWWFSTTVFLQYLTTNWFGFVLFSKSSCLILKTIFDYWHFRLKQNFSQFIAKIMSSHEPLLPPWFLTYLLPAKWFLKNTTTSSMMMVLRKKVGSGSIQDDAMIFSHWKWNLLIFRKMLFKTSLDLDFTSRWIFNGGSKSFAMKWPSISLKKNKIRPFTFLARILIFCLISSGLWNFQISWCLINK